MQENFQAFFAAALEHEGKVFEDVPGDRGGPTKWGITIGRLAQVKGVKCPAKGTAAYAALRQELKDLAPERIEEIYRADYWDAVRGDELPAGLDYCVADFGLNSGPSRAVKYLQRLLEQPQTGTLQDEAIQEIARHPLDELITTYCDERARFLNQIVENNPSQAKFRKGWLSRVGDVRKTATKMAASAPVPETVRVAMPKADVPEHGSEEKTSLLDTSERNFSILNSLANQGSRIASSIRDLKRFVWWGGGGTTMAVGAVKQTKTGATLGEIMAANPFATFMLGMLIALAVAWIYAKRQELGLVSAHKDNRYQPKGGTA